MTQVRGSRVLIVEDEYLLATELSRYFHKMGAEILGPVSCPDAAEEHVDHADAAVLDIDLNGRTVFPVADRLLGRGIPFVFYSGRDDISVPSRFLHACLLHKPLDRKSVFNALFASADRGRKSVPRENDVLACLPKLQLAARLLMEESAAADRLVEATLKRAVDEIADRPSYVSLDAWLIHLLDQIHDDFGRDLHH